VLTQVIIIVDYLAASVLEHPNRRLIPTARSAVRVLLLPIANMKLRVVYDLLLILLIQKVRPSAITLKESYRL
jgi:hypothetical protein